VLAEAARERFFPRGSVLLREGEPVEAIHYLVEGRVRASFKGRDLGVAPPGAAIGALGVLTQSEEGFEAVAETDVLTLEQDRDAVFEILEDNFAILRHTLQDFCRRMIDSVVKGPVEPESIPHSAWKAASDDLDLVDRIFILRRAPPFARASLNALAELARAVVQVRFEPGTRLWRVGEPGRNVVLLVSGTVRCTSANRRSFVAGAGWPLGAVEALGGTTRWYEPVTETAVVGLSGDVETLYDVLEDNFDMAMGYLSTMGRAWLRSMERIADSHPELLKQFIGTE
jgi:CRP-like cAMP-binding protein